MAEQTSAAFTALDIDRPLRVLDFGCGDAQPMIPQLQLRPVASYTGYDLSSSALELAEQNLSRLECAYQLRCAPMQSFVETEEGNFDVIHSSYAIHHLQDDEKKKLLQNCYARLNAKGVMIMIDILRNEGQTKDEYIEEYIDNIKATWQMVTEEEKQQVFDHMRNYDFPAVTGDVVNWATETGFTVQQHRIDERHTMLILEKS